MRSTQLTLGALAAAATSALTGLGIATPATAAPAPTSFAAQAETTTTHEVGNVIECTGTIRGRSVWASVYENNTYANVIQVVIGDDGDQVGNSREDADGFIDHRQVLGALKVDGKRAVIEGRAVRVGSREQVHEEYDDAGQLVTVDGFHRRLSTDLTLTWRHRTRPLTCDTAFHYDLQVTKEDITG
ncbi:hypothetical protein ACT8ZV_11745 [Nocardioides sp. MAHUQ-72]|uniref:hypothetical protein n=1 Tax=unclassified Nocardioides TaxID=2615069 RepID=UPI003611C72B